MKRLLIAPLMAAVIIACGARTAVIGAQGGDSTNGTANAACGDTATLATSITLDAASPVHEPESPPHLVWKGPELFVLDSRWDDGTYAFAMASVTAGSGTLVPTSTARLSEIGDVLDLRAAWDGGALALVFNQSQSALVLERRTAGGTLLGARTTLVSGDVGQVTPLSLLADSTQYTAVWAAQNQATNDFDVRVGRFSSAGATLLPPSLLRTDQAGELDTTLARAQGQLFAAWSALERDTSTSFVGALGSDDVVRNTTTIETGLDHVISNLVFDGSELSAAIFDFGTHKATVWSRTLAPGTFRKRAELDATSPLTLATDACGHLGALVPTGTYSNDNPLSNGLSFRLVAADGTLGAEIVLPVGHEYVEGWDLAAVDGGFVAAWIEGDQNNASPSRTLKLAAIDIQ